MNKPDESDVGLATVVSAICFFVSVCLAVFAVFLSDAAPLWAKGLFVALSLFFAWLLFVASPSTRVWVMRWLPLP